MSETLDKYIASLNAIREELDYLESLLKQTPESTRKIVEEICRKDIELCKRIFTPNGKLRL